MIVPPVIGQALPVVKSMVDCTDWSLTVAPFIDQLTTLPQRILDTGFAVDALKEVYISTNPLITAFAFSLAISPIFLIVAEINRNYSQVDRCWSILPSIYNAHYALWARYNGIPTQRLDNILAFSVCWSIRLTFNYWRRGGYSVGSEDYRWEIVQKYVNRFQMFLFNVVFISTTQSVLLFMITTPAYILLLASRLTGEQMQTVDLVFARVLMGFVLVEFFADQQQWDFHKAKAQYQKTAKVPHKWTRSEMDRGFCSSALWAYSRHPNFLAEQSIWLTFYQWGCWETGVLYNWTGIGAMSYLILFQGSTWLTEKISAGKYPEYKEYQKRVGKFVPKPNGGSWIDYCVAHEEELQQKKK
ncbi:hypothetical protein AAFC00_004565 [Neodothiora populina]|uniref:DUF1295-domain-containing protein n=1 Tax=Neodothiora populina TaxID=2781224 RepID=A0ABR3P2L7_9PEZI